MYCKQSSRQSSLQQQVTLVHQQRWPINPCTYPCNAICDLITVESKIGTGRYLALFRSLTSSPRPASTEGGSREAGACRHARQEPTTAGQGGTSGLIVETAKIETSGGVWRSRVGGVEACRGFLGGVVICLIFSGDCIKRHP